MSKLGRLVDNTGPLSPICLKRREGNAAVTETSAWSAMGARSSGTVALSPISTSRACKTFGCDSTLACLGNISPHADPRQDNGRPSAPRGQDDLRRRSVVAVASAADADEARSSTVLRSAGHLANRRPNGCFPPPVSYTHLTLPTNEFV